MKQTGSAYAGANQGLKSTGKSNHETATLRAGNLPKPQAVRDAKPTPGAAVKCAQKQNTSDGGDYKKHRNVIPNESDESIVAVGVVKVKE